MSQQINLFEGALVKSKDWFTLPLVAGVYALVACVMIYDFTGLQDEVAQLEVQRNQAKAQYEVIQKKLDELAKSVVPVDNSKLEAELKTLKARFDMQTQILAMFQQSISNDSQHLVDYMRALTAQQQPGLWLTGFRIEPAAQHLTLDGQALQSESIPSYLDLLSKRAIFAGTQFSGMQVKQVELRKNQTPTSAVATPVAPVPAPTSVNEPSAVGKDAPESAGAPAAPTAPSMPVANLAPAPEVTLQVYAFDVKGQDLQSQAKRDNTLSWDEFVRQTTQSLSAQPMKE